ncbi:GNAT family N-acetyltransferase [Gynuella sp.]|uniref:GNAT family N-acetyltransferase n=1 Tax=Gynuella sp. TaxID=2969146 RepID=UPI003D0ECF0A
MKILEAESSDIPLLTKLMTQFNVEESIELPVEVMKKTIELSFSNRNYIQTFIAYEGNSVVGYIHICYSFSFEYQGLEASIDEIFILKEFRGLGLAKVLFDDIENEIKSRGAVAIRADVSDDKPWLDGFYKKLGFCQVSYRPYYKQL